MPGLAGRSPGCPGHEQGSEVWKGPPRTPCPDRIPRAWREILDHAVPWTGETSGMLARAIQRDRRRCAVCQARQRIHGLTHRPLSLIPPMRPIIGSQARGDRIRNVRLNRQRGYAAIFDPMLLPGCQRARSFRNGAVLTCTRCGMPVGHRSVCVPWIRIMLRCAHGTGRCSATR